MLKKSERRHKDTRHGLAVSVGLRVISSRPAPRFAELTLVGLTLPLGLTASDLELTIGSIRALSTIGVVT